MGVAKAQLAAYITAKRNGKGSVPVCSAAEIAIGVNKTAVAALLKMLVNMATARKIAERIAKVPNGDATRTTSSAINWAAPVLSSATPIVRAAAITR